METSRKIKYSGIDRLILGIAYALLGFVCSFDCYTFDICSSGIFYGSDCFK